MSTGSGNWRVAFKELQNESDRGKLQEKVTAVESAIFYRWQELEKFPPDETEMEEIRIASKELLRIKVEKLGFP